jgi:hypothetical protein
MVSLPPVVVGYPTDEARRGQGDREAPFVLYDDTLLS